ncbi:MAG TPA: hypothetical protein VFH15_07635 [Pyrinomonadaceae bacterium]|nr:hypothetical protein [Pyrinomonadaceae bacterium]
MLRIASLALVLVMSTGVLLPFTDSSAHGLRQSFITKRNFHHRRHSRAWWRRYRARMARIRLKRRQEAAIMAHRKSVLRPVMPMPLAKAAPAPVAIPVPELVLASIPGTVPASVAVPVPTSTSVPATVLPPASRKVPTPAIVPVPRSVMVSAPVAVTIPAPPAKAVAASSQTVSARPLKTVRASASVTVPALATKTVLAGAAKPVAATVRPTAPVAANAPQLPAGWNSLGATKTGEVKFRTETATGVLNGQASLDVVSKSRPNPLYMSAREERRLLAGVAIGDLRRIVIDKMISDGGWVTNDYFRDVAGQRVFIVSAQTPGDGRNPDKSWNFYFTEVNGRIYRLTTNTPQEFSERMAAEAESFIASFHAISKPAQ